MPGDFGGPVCSCALSLVGLHTRPRVHRAPGIPARPLFSRAAENNGKPRAVRAARMRTHVLRTLCLEVTPMFQRHCEELLRRSNPFLLLACRALDCFAYARNDVLVREHHTPMSSSGLTGRSSIPEMPAIEPRSRGVLDPPLEPVIGLAGGETRWRRMTTCC